MKILLLLFSFTIFTSCGSGDAAKTSNAESVTVDTSVPGTVLTDTTGAKTVNADTTGMRNAR